MDTRTQTPFRRVILIATKLEYVNYRKTTPVSVAYLLAYLQQSININIHFWQRFFFFSIHLFIHLFMIKY